MNDSYYYDQMDYLWHEIHSAKMDEFEYIYECLEQMNHIPHMIDMRICFLVTCWCLNLPQADKGRIQGQHQTTLNLVASPTRSGEGPLRVTLTKL